MSTSIHIHPAAAFESDYLSLRKQEEWIYSDEQVALLPSVAENDPHYSEWQVRRKSAERLVDYFNKKKGRLQLLEVGCGNGWLASKLADREKSDVTGIDVNLTELEQAQRVFQHRKNLQFIRTGFQSFRETENRFDAIIFAASIQYFASLPILLNAALRLLKSKGEIHIVDSMLYSAEEVKHAQKRTAEYFEKMGFAAMKDFYFHHKLVDLKLFRHRILFNPHALGNKLFSQQQPFYWIRINGPE